LVASGKGRKLFCEPNAEIRKGCVIGGQKNLLKSACLLIGDIVNYIT
jgi:hypothetical protein